MMRLLIVGAGGHGRSVAETAVISGYTNFLGFVDDAYENVNKVWNYPVWGTTTNLARYRVAPEISITP